MKKNDVKISKSESLDSTKRVVILVLIVTSIFSLISITSFIDSNFAIDELKSLLIPFIISSACIYFIIKLAKESNRLKRVEAEAISKKVAYDNKIYEKIQNLKSKSGHSPIRSIYLGGSGINLKALQEIYITFNPDLIELNDVEFSGKFSINYAEISSLEVGGSGTVTSNAGLSGGGFGLEGFLGGVVLASVINAATSKSNTNTFLRILTRNSEAYFHISTLEPSELRLLVSPAIIAIEDQKRVRVEKPRSVSDEIQKLHVQMLDGVISEDEFKSAKKILLN